MGFFYFLFALLPLAVAEVPTDYNACPNRTWELGKDPIKHRCVYFCSNGSGWLIAYFTNFTICWYEDNVNGTCYDGLCYNSLPENVTTGVSPATTEVMSTTSSTESNQETTNALSTESSASEGTPTTKKEETGEEKGKEKKKKKKKKKKEKKGTEIPEW